MADEKQSKTTEKAGPKTAKPQNHIIVLRESRQHSVAEKQLISPVKVLQSVGKSTSGRVPEVAEVAAAGSKRSIPEWKIAVEPFNNKEIPNWQANMDPAINITVLLLAFFWLVLNTKQRQSVVVLRRG